MNLLKIKGISWISYEGFIAFFLLWTFIYLFSIYDSLLIPSPLDVFGELSRFFYTINLMFSFGATLLRIIIAFVFSMVIGVAFGLAMGFSEKLNELTGGFVDFLRSIPGIALFPLFILFFGVGEVSRILVAMFVAIPIIIINTKYGVLNSRKHRKDLYKIYKISKLDIFRKIIIPEASPYIFTGLRVAISLIIILIIVTEMMLGTKYGLGQLLVNSQYQFETAMMYAVIIFLGVMGSVLNFYFNLFEKKIFHWR